MNPLRAAATVSGLTLLSRITGLARETLTASLFGAGPATDAFFVAFRLPNLLRRLFAEGAFTQAFVPILAQARRRNPDEAHHVINLVATGLFWVLVLVTLTGIVAAPVLVWLVAGGLSAVGESFDLAVLLTRWMFPYILLISLVAMAQGILNTWQRFAAPAFAPVLLNISCIACALLLAPHLNQPIFALAIGVMIGGVAQLLWQIPSLRAIGMLPHIGFQLRAVWADPTVRRVLRQMGPAVLAVSVAQLSLIINTRIASGLGPGSVSWISFADRLMEFPIALLGSAMGTALLPTLSAASAADDSERFSNLLDWALRLAVLLALPCMAGLALLSQPLTALLFHYGQFSAHDLTMTAQAVQAYGSGLLGLICIRILAPGFFARQDIRTPTRIALVVLVVTQGLNFVFVPYFQHAGLALSISVAAWINAALLGAGLLRRGVFRPRPGWGMHLLRCALATALLSALLWYGAGQFDWIALGRTPVWRATLVLGLVAGATLVFFATLRITGMRPMTLLRPPQPSAPPLNVQHRP